MKETLPTQPFQDDTRRAPNPSTGSGAAGGTAPRDSVRVFRHFVWFEVGSGKLALSRPAWWLTSVAVSKPTSTLRGSPQGTDANPAVGLCTEE
jgi:hypothetical protein